MIEKSSPEFASLLGEAIVALSYRMCGVSPLALVPAGGVVQGFDKLDPEYIQVTENRDGPGPEQRKHYSSCGDQLHAILERVGVRLPFVNRKSLWGKFAYGENITRLLKPACPFAGSAPLNAPDYAPPAGSLCLIWMSGLDAHALTILGDGSDTRHLRTGNYGAGGMSAATAPGADVADSPFVPELVPVFDAQGKPAKDAHGAPVLRATGYKVVGASKRRLHTVITPASIIPYIDAQIDLSGCAVTGELVDALGARYE